MSDSHRHHHHDRSRSPRPDRSEQDRDGHRSTHSSSHSHRHHSKSKSRSRSRSRSKDRSSHHSSYRHADRSGSDSESDEKDHKKKKHSKDSKKESKSKSDSKSIDKSKRKELEKQVKKAKKLLKSSNPDSQLEAAAILQSPELIQYLAMEKQSLAEKEAKRAEKSNKKKEKKLKKKKKDHKDSESESDSGSDSDSDDDDLDDMEDDSPVQYLADGVTPKLKPRDFFARSTEFRVWLHSTHGKHVDDITSKKSRSYFRQFIDAWNNGSLSSSYYKGMDSTSSGAGAAALTKHKWKFASKMTEAEKMSIATMRDDIDTATYHHTYQQEFQPGTTANSNASTRPSSSTTASSQPPPAVSSSSTSASDRTRDKLDQKRLASYHATVLEELVPKATGREAQIEKRQQKGAYAHVDKDQGGVATGMSERDMMGSSGQADYQAMLAKQKANQSKVDAERASKLSDYQAKEKEKMKNLLNSLGLADKYPMQ